MKRDVFDFRTDEFDGARARGRHGATAFTVATEGRLGFDLAYAFEGVRTDVEWDDSAGSGSGAKRTTTGNRRHPPYGTVAPPLPSAFQTSRALKLSR